MKYTKPIIELENLLNEDVILSSSLTGWDLLDQTHGDSQQWNFDGNFTTGG